MIKREQKSILITDNFLTFSSALIIKSETADNLRDGLILLISDMGHPGPISISTDYAPGFLSLSRGNGKQLQELQITVFTSFV